MKFKFRAKPKNEITDDSFLHESEFYKDGFYEGFLIQDRIYAYLVNGVAECQEDYIAIEEWCVIDPKTIEPLFPTCTANERKFLDEIREKGAWVEYEYSDESEIFIAQEIQLGHSTICAEDFYLANLQELVNE